jgi:uncharacterized protein RhaS with RHS repeats
MRRLPREYDADTGQWPTTDPLGFAGGSENLYAYVHGDPINLVDASWLRPLSACEKALLSPFLPRSSLDRTEIKFGRPRWMLDS